MADELMRVIMRPLSISMLEGSLPVNVSHEPGDVALRLIADLIGDTVKQPLEYARARYRQVSNEADEPVVVPMHPTIIKHIVRPLVEAKHCYVLGMPVACIAQAGLVGEMVALWRFQMLSSTVDGKPLDEVMQKSLMGRTFDKLGQQERVRVLQVLDSIDGDTVHAFDELRLLRRRYLHFMVEETGNTDVDARQALKLACDLTAKTLGVTFNEGRLVLPEKVARFVRSMVGPDTSVEG